MNPKSLYLSETPQRSVAIIAGLGLLVMAVLAPLANFGVLQKLLVAADPAATVAKIAASGHVFRLGIAGFALVVLLDVIVA